MSKRKNLQLSQKKDNNLKEFSQNQEKENRLLQDIQLLSSLKSIPGKIITLNNKINTVSKNTKKENSNDNNNKLETNNIIYHKSKLSFSPVNKQIINNYTINNINNSYTINNYFYTNLNFSLNNQPDEIGFLPDQSNFLESPLFFQSSNNPSFLSMKSDMKNNFIFTENKFTQNSFIFQNILFNGNNSNQITILFK